MSQHIKVKVANKFVMLSGEALAKSAIKNNIDVVSLEQSIINFCAKSNSPEQYKKAFAREAIETYKATLDVNKNKDVIKEDIKND